MTIIHETTTNAQEQEKVQYIVQENDKDNIWIWYQWTDTRDENLCVAIWRLKYKTT